LAIWRHPRADRFPAKVVELLKDDFIIGDVTAPVQRQADYTRNRLLRGQKHAISLEIAEMQIVIGEARKEMAEIRKA
jgi:hypothetical protein